MTRVLSSSYLTALWFILVGSGGSSLAAEAPVRVVVSFGILEDWWAKIVAHQIVMDSRGFSSAGNLSNCFRGSREPHYPY
jgi:hypothetical protein